MILTTIRQKVEQLEVENKIKVALSKSKKTLFYVGFLSFFINLFMLTPALYMLQLYDRVVTGRSEETLIMLTLILVFIFTFLFLLDWSRNKIMVRVANNLDKSLDKNVFSSLFKWSLNEPSSANVTPLRDINQIRNFITSPGLLALFDAPWAIGYMVILFLFHTYYGLFSLFAVFVVAVLIYLNEKSTKKNQEETNNLYSQNVEATNSFLKNSEVVHSMGMNQSLYNNYSSIHNEWIQKQTVVNDLSSTWSGLTKYLRMLFQSLILGVGAYLVINMELTSGMMIAGSILLGRVLAPMDLLVGQWKNIILTRQAFVRLDKLLNEYDEQKQLMPLPAPKGAVSIKSLVVIPPKAQKPSLKGIDLDIEVAEVVGIIGASASGKSSLLKAMLGIWPLSNGVVKIDSVDITQWENEKLGKFIGYLPQDIELFSGTVAQNIARMDEVNSELVIKAAQLADLHEMILTLPDGYNTQIGSAGVTLSGGQKQRVALARAVYGDVKLVVLDEPNSNLDDLGELALVKTIQRLKSASITVIMVTHKMNILKYTDRVVIVKDGLIQSNSTTVEFFNAISKNNRIANA